MVDIPHEHSLKACVVVDIVRFSVCLAFVEGVSSVQCNCKWIKAYKCCGIRGIKDIIRMDWTSNSK